LSFGAYPDDPGGMPIITIFTFEDSPRLTAKQARRASKNLLEAAQYLEQCAKEKK